MQPTSRLVGCLAPLAFVLLMTLISGASAPAGALAAEACLDVVEASQDVAKESRSRSSYLAVVRSAESDARTAVSESPRYRPILEAIAALRNALGTGRQDRAAATLTVLASLCD